MNNVFRNADPESQSGWQASPCPQVVFTDYDGFTGRLLYAESIVLE